MGHGINDSWLVTGDSLLPENPNEIIHLLTS